LYSSQISVCIHWRHVDVVMEINWQEMHNWNLCGKTEVGFEVASDAARALETRRVGPARHPLERAIPSTGHGGAEMSIRPVLGFVAWG
jgi:hypothetical protein